MKIILLLISSNTFNILHMHTYTQKKSFSFLIITKNVCSLYIIIIITNEQNKNLSSYSPNPNPINGIHKSTADITGIVKLSSKFQSKLLTPSEMEATRPP